jgi:ferritin-like metal-binding protein YciE
MEALQKLLQNELEDLYDAEQQIVKALPKMIEGSSSPELQRALKQHLEVTQNQVTRLEQVFERLGEKTRKKPCKGMAGIIAEGSELLQEDLEDSTMDAGIIGAAQKVEHYEIASYGTARTLAQTLGNNEVAELLEETLEEEKEADELLTQIAESSINAEAAAEEGEGEEEENGRRSGNSRSRASSRSSSSSSSRRGGASARGKTRRRRSRTSARR